MTNANNNVYVKEEWDELLARAQSLLCDTEKDGQVVLAQTYGGKIYHQTTAKSALTEQLKQENDTAVEKMLCVWHNGSVDIPSFLLRDQLYKTNQKNLRMKMLLQGADSFVVKTLEQTLPPSYERNEQK